MLMIEERDAEAKRKKKELQKARGVEHYMHAMSNLVGQQLHIAPRGEHRAPLPPVSLIAPAPRPSVLVPRSARTDAERRMRRRASEDQRVGAMRLRMAQLLPEPRLSKAAPMSLKSKRSSATEQRLGDVRPPKRPSATGRSATGRRRLVARKPHPTIRQHSARTRSYKERLARVTASVRLPPSHAAASVGSAAMPARKTSVGEIVRRASVLSAQRLNLQGMLPPPPSYKDSPPPYNDDDDDDDASSSSGGVLEPLLEEGTSGGDLNPWGGADAAAGSGATPARAEGEEEGGWEEYFDETNQAWYALHAATGRSYWVDEEDDGEEEAEDASYSSEEEEEEGGDRLAPLHRQASMSSARRGSTFVSHLLSIDDDLSANSTTRRSVRLSGRFQL
tara:strand:+ start:486 stop:1658 length:1173 start_codon:yes stop_codon:yes gene_type:complete